MCDLEYRVREIPGQPEPTLKNVTVAQLNSQVEAAFKLIEKRRAVS